MTHVAIVKLIGFKTELNECNWMFNLQPLKCILIPSSTIDNYKLLPNISYHEWLKIITAIEISKFEKFYKTCSNGL